MIHPRRAIQRARNDLGRYDPVRHTALILSARSRSPYSNELPPPAHVRSFHDYAGNGANFDPTNRMPHRRPSRAHWGPKVHKANKGEIEKPKKGSVPQATPAPSGKSGKLGKAAAAFGMVALLILFPPPPNSGVRAVYTASQGIGGRPKQEPW
jgi:hypothetical protein